jgi:peptidoglycan/xylan/chitin deacetylase (PgdA/CDA1 family)
MWSRLKYSIFLMLHLVGRLAPRRGVPVLGYHAVDDLGTPVSTPVALFRAQMQYLKEQGYQPMTLGQWKDAHAAGRPLQKPVVLTFDDGTTDFRETVVPILREFGFVATVFVVPGLVGGRGTWQKFAPIPDPRLMTWDELREVQALGMEIQNHTHTHPLLSRLAPERAREEMAAARAEIAAQLNAPADFIACPYGDCSEAVVAEARALGISGMFPHTFGLESASPRDWLRMKRLGMDYLKGNPRLKLLFFKASLLGTAEWYIQGRYWLKRLLPRRLAGGAGPGLQRGLPVSGAGLS